MVFVLAIITANLWFEVVINTVITVFKINRNEFKLWLWIVIALAFSIIAYIVINHIIKLPITAAFSL